MKKLDIMNMRAGEEWILVNGKEKRIERKVTIITDDTDKEAIELIKKVAKIVNKRSKKNEK